MDRMWLFSRLAVSVDVVDFLDPAVAAEPDARERGVRIEVRPVAATRTGSIYASDPISLDPALCRLDFLESAPGAADRMHWHPEMSDGEPGDRSFDPLMPRDPQGWLLAFLRVGLEEHLARRGLLDPGTSRDLAGIGLASQEVVAALSVGLTLARQPWPTVERDERGMAVAG